MKLQTIAGWVIRFYLGFALAYAIVSIVQGAEPVLSWAGMAIAAGSALAGVQLKASEGAAKLLVSIICGLGLGITLVLSHRYGPAAGLAHLWAGLSLIAWFAWTRVLRD